MCVSLFLTATKKGSEELEPVVLPLLGIHHAGLIQALPVVKERIPAGTTVRLEQHGRQLEMDAFDVAKRNGDAMETQQSGGAETMQQCRPTPQKIALQQGINAGWFVFWTPL